MRRQSQRLQPPVTQAKQRPDADAPKPACIATLRAREPPVKKIEGDIWELRRESRGNTYRIFYFFFTGRKIVLLHAIQKKTERTPRREIELAQRRLDHFVRREEGGET